MRLEELYSDWGSRRDLDPLLIEQVARSAVSKGSGDLAELVMKQILATPESLAMIRNSKIPTVAVAWMYSHQITQAERLAYVKEADPELLAAMYTRWQSCMSDDVRKAMWRRRNTLLRLRVLQTARWSDSLPDSWGKWLMSAWHKGAHRAEAADTFHALAEELPEWVWKYAAAELALEPLALIVSGTKNGRGGYYVDEIDDILTQVIDQEMTADQQTDAVLLYRAALVAAGKGRASLSTAPGTQFGDLGRRLLVALPESSLIRDELLELLGGLGSALSGPGPSRAEIVAQLAAGTVSDAAIDAAAAGEDDDLCHLVITHSALKPVEAVRLISEKFDRKLFEKLFENRTAAWTKKVAIGFWESGYRVGRRQIIMDLFRALSWQQRYRAVTALADKDPSNIGQIYDFQLGLPDIAAKLPLADVDRAHADIRSDLYRAAVNVFTTTAQWEVFETLSAEFEGTYQQLLDTVLALQPES